MPDFQIDFMIFFFNEVLEKFEGIFFLLQEFKVIMKISLNFMIKSKNETTVVYYFLLNVLIFLLNVLIFLLNVLIFLLNVLIFLLNVSII